MQISYKDEQVRDWWQQLGKLGRMRLLEDRLSPGAYRLPWTNLLEADRQEARVAFEAEGRHHGAMAR